MTLLAAAAAGYSYAIVGETLAWQRDANRAALRRDAELREGIARSVQQSRISVLGREVLPFLAGVMTADRITVADADRARELEQERGWAVREDANRGWRRVVPSPKPLAVLELEPIRTLLESGALVVAVGGGGIPVVARDGRHDGVDAVIDKDHASALLASALGADRLVILTQVPAVYTGFGTDEQRALDELVPGLDDGLIDSLPPGSMRPKVEAAFRFVSETGGEALITSSDALAAGGPGTRVVAR